MARRMWAAAAIHHEDASRGRGVRLNTKRSLTAAGCGRYGWSCVQRWNGSRARLEAAAGGWRAFRTDRVAALSNPLSEGAMNASHPRARNRDRHRRRPARGQEPARLVAPSQPYQQARAVVTSARGHRARRSPPRRVPPASRRGCDDRFSPAGDWIGIRQSSLSRQRAIPISRSRRWRPGCRRWRRCGDVEGRSPRTNRPMIVEAKTRRVQRASIRSRSRRLRARSVSQSRKAESFYEAGDDRRFIPLLARR